MFLASMFDVICEFVLPGPSYSHNTLSVYSLFFLYAFTTFAAIHQSYTISETFDGSCDIFAQNPL